MSPKTGHVDVLAVRRRPEKPGFATSEGSGKIQKSHGGPASSTHSEAYDVAKGIDKT